MASPLKTKFSAKIWTRICNNRKPVMHVYYNKTCSVSSLLCDLYTAWTEVPCFDRLLSSLEILLAFTPIEWSTHLWSLRIIKLACHQTQTLNIAKTLVHCVNLPKKINSLHSTFYILFWFLHSLNSCDAKEYKCNLNNFGDYLVTWAQHICI